MTSKEDNRVLATQAPTTTTAPKRSMQEVLADWDDTSTPTDTTTTTPTNTPANAIPALNTADIVTEEGERYVYNPDTRRHEFHSMVHPAEKPRKLRTRQAAIPFDADMIRTIRTLRKTGYTIPEITACVREHPGYDRATPDIVRLRIERGPTKVREQRTIPYDHFLTILNKDRDSYE